MCDSLRYVHNSYIHKTVLVSCGKCKACQQEKANARALRIRNHSDNRLCLFVMLSYENRFVPYIISSDIIGLDNVSCRSVNVYRDASFRWYRSKRFIKNESSLVTSFSSSELLPYQYNVPYLRKKHGCTGVIYWPDVQNFIKRLRQLLKRYYSDEIKLSYYACGEYGERTFRPHFHLLLYFTKGTLETLRPFIIKAWPYGDMRKSSKRIQVARDASGYVASYLNKSEGLPEILTSSVIRQKHSHSLYFGANLSAFSLSSLLEKADRQDMSYNRTVIANGQPLLVALPIPKYVISRYFPKFKGYSSFTTPEVLRILRLPQDLWNRLGDSCQLPVCDSKCNVRYYFKQWSDLICHDLLYSPEQYRRFIVHLRNCYEYYHAITGRNIDDYAIDYCRVWQARWCYVFRHSFDNIHSVLDYGYHYENANEFVEDPSIAPTLPTPDKVYYEINPNERLDYRLKHNNLTALFDKKEHLREINSIVMSSIDEEF
jgi:hypothetical protein